MRKAGILMPIASLPSKYGCGSFGKEAYTFVDKIAKGGFAYWQILPLNPLGYGNSPYQPYSSYAMDELYISLDFLVQLGLLDQVPSFHRHHKRIAYDVVRQVHTKYLRQAFNRFSQDSNYLHFIQQQWVKEYALFTAFKHLNHHTEWTMWNPSMKDFPIHPSIDIDMYKHEIDYHMFVQYIAYQQWMDLKRYANRKGIEMIGDVPFYVGMDSADVWAHRRDFLLDKDGRPTFVAGVPPDYFSKTGQRWGNPIYDWKYMQEDHFTFWLERLAYAGKIFDQVRIDHFRAFDTYWKIPVSCPTAVEGEWIEAPGYAFFDTLFSKYPAIKILAEDLGDLRDEVIQLRNHYHLTGMKVLQFDFAEIASLPDEHCLVYTGTHDNDTLYAWYRHQTRLKQRSLRQYLYHLGYRKHRFVSNAIAYALDSRASMVIVPMADWIHAGREARINLPGKVDTTNWSWRMKDIHALLKKSQRI